METRASYFMVGLFVLLLVGAGLGFALWAAKPEAENTMRYTVHFEGAVTGLRLGSDVRFQGVRVGEVVGISINPDTEAIDVVIEVERMTPVRRNTTAQLEIQGITGVSFIQLASGPDDAAVDREFYPGTTEPPYPVLEADLSNLQKVFEGFPKLLDELQGAISRFSLLLSDRNLATLEETLKNFNALTARMVASADEIDTVFSNANQTLASVHELSRSLSTTVEDLKVMTERAVVTLDDVQTAANDVSVFSRNLTAIAGENRRPLRDFTATGLYDLSQLLTEMRDLVQSLQRISLKIEQDPARFLFGDQHQGYPSK